MCRCSLYYLFKGLLVIVFAPDIIMMGHGQFVCKQAVFILVHILFQYCLDRFVVVDTMAKCPLAHTDQPLFTSLFGEGQDAHARPVSLFGMLFAVQDFMYIKTYVFVD